MWQSLTTGFHVVYAEDDEVEWLNGQRWLLRFPAHENFLFSANIQYAITILTRTVVTLYYYYILCPV